MLGSRRNRGRSRRRLRFSLILIAIIGGAIGLYAIGRTAYMTGEYLAESQVRTLEEERDRLTRSLSGAQIQRDAVQAKLNEANEALATLKRRYEKDVPTGPAADLFTLARDRMAAGLPAERLRQAIAGAEPVRACDGRSSRKRIAVQPAGTRMLDIVPFLDGLVGIAATAPAAADNPAQAASVSLYAVWMDKPIAFTTLPVKHDLTLNNAVLRLVVEPSEMRGYLNATLSSCYPKAS